jgi:hypothetical protein
MSNIRYRDLTDSQIDTLIAKGVLNGCGGKGGWLNPPDFIFTASCNHHDFNYWLGNTEEDRLKADRQFYQAMINDANEHPWYKRYFYKTLAWIYYKAVRLFAKKFFHYAKQERTREDLDRVLEA